VRFFFGYKAALSVQCTITMRYDKQRRRRLLACSAIAPQNSFFSCCSSNFVRLRCTCMRSLFFRRILLPERKKLLQLFFVPRAPARRTKWTRAGRNYTTSWCVCSIITHCLRLSLTLYRQCRPSSRSGDGKRERAHEWCCVLHPSLFIFNCCWCGVVSHYYY
jgi:hypothetical protein